MKKPVTILYMSAWAPETPYNDLPDLPDWDLLETKSVLKSTASARAAIAALNQAARSMPNPTVLINTIPLLEAQASSEIENVVTTTDRLFKFSSSTTNAADSATREALRYRRALYEGFVNLRQRAVLTPATAMEICSTIKMRTMSLRDGPGTYIGNPITKRAIYTPPDSEPVIREKLDHWAQFVNSPSSVDPLVKMAAAHYQFEAIHPFEDGNGRTGRVLNVLSLVADDVLVLPILYLSRFIIMNKSEYYRRLLAVTADGDWDGWLIFMLEGMRQTADFTLDQIAAFRGLHEEFKEHLRALFNGVNADLLEVLFEQPYCRTQDVVGRCHVSRPTAANWLKTLVEAGHLQSLKEGKERLYINHQFLEMLLQPERATSW